MKYLLHNKFDMNLNKKTIMAPRTVGAMIVKTVSCNKSLLLLPFLFLFYHD